MLSQESSGAASPGGPDPRETGARIEQVLEEFRTSALPDVTERAEELVELLVDLYGTGLQRFVELLSEEPDGPGVLRRLASDDLVGSLLVLHDLHPDDTETRVLAALDKVRPYLGSHAGGVTYLGIDEEGAVQLRLEGSCDGCPSSLVTVKMAIEGAISQAAPEIVRVEVEGVTAEKKPAQDGKQLFELAPPPRLEGGWAPVEGTLELADSEVTSIVLEGVAVAVCRAEGHLYAFLDRCPRCSSGLAGARLVGMMLCCQGCDERFNVQLAGRGTDGSHLDPLPLLGEADQLRIAVPTGALP